MTKALDEIWDGDLFGRREEAQNLEAYIESIWKKQNLHEDSKGFVISVDADYGMGKTYFLKRFADQLSINHPVAYIDAWKDDFHNEPMITLISTLDEALSKFLDRKRVKDKWEKAKVALKKLGLSSIKGAAKRALSLAITSDSADDVIENVSSLYGLSKEAIEEALSKSSEETINGLGSLLEVNDNMLGVDEGIIEFRKSRKYLSDFKESLNELVGAISLKKVYPPIVIIIDELDRCRPDYAIKMLETVKHLFDVEGIVFILGTNLIQLEKSVKVSYGSEFEALNYLGRFFDRHYKLLDAELNLLIKKLISDLKIDLKKFSHLRIITEDERSYESCIEDTQEIICFYINKLMLSARDTIKLINSLKVCEAVSGRMHLLLAPVLFKIIGFHLKKNFELRSNVPPFNGYYVNVYNPDSGELVTTPLSEYIAEANEYSDFGVAKYIYHGKNNYLKEHFVMYHSYDNAVQYYKGNYNNLINSVVRFS